MPSSIDNIVVLLPPPSVPSENGGKPWSEIEQSIGSVLPADYKNFIETYGSGRINKFIFALNPFSMRRGLNLIDQIPRQLDALRTLITDFAETCPYALFPEHEGLLPFALTDNGDVIFWMTRGEPDEWSVVVNESRAPSYEEFGGGAISFFIALMTGAHTFRAFPSSIASMTPRFDPILPV